MWSTMKGLNEALEFACFSRNVRGVSAMALKLGSFFSSLMPNISVAPGCLFLVSRNGDQLVGS